MIVYSYIDTPTLIFKVGRLSKSELHTVQTSAIVRQGKDMRLEFTDKEEFTHLLHEQRGYLGYYNNIVLLF